MKKALMQRLKLGYLLFLLLLPYGAFCQLNLYGRVLDSDTKGSLAFVSIAIKGKQAGVISDIDGKWQLAGLKRSDTLVFSYIGYERKLISVSTVNDHEKELLVYMRPQAYQLNEVVINPKENPAHRIIRAALNNKKQNNWERIPEFTYQAYNRFHITNAAEDTLTDTVYSGRGSVSVMLMDSAGESDSFFREQHLFLTESVVKKNFRAPDRQKITIIASKVSGTSDPRFSLLAGTFNDLNIYKDYVDVAGKNYLSPIAYNAINKYNFRLEDTLWVDENRSDTIFLISYKPKSNTLFNAFRGILYIHSDGYAVQNIIARPVGEVGGLNVKIQQQYKKIDGKWFPEQVNADYIFGKIGGIDKYIIGVDRSYITEVDFSPELKGRDLRGAAIEIDVGAAKHDSTYWSDVRVDTLSSKDIKTYIVLDSVGKEARIDTKLAFLEALANMRLPLYKFIDLDLRRIFFTNPYEKVRLGLGLLTNDKLSPYFELGAYGGYGFGDKALKYGGSLTVKPVYGSIFRIVASYHKDLQEFAGRRYDIDEKIELHERIRRGTIADFYTEKQYRLAIRWKWLGYLRTEIGANARKLDLLHTYIYTPRLAEATKPTGLNELTASFRYAYNEKIFSALGKQYNLGTKYPTFWLDITKGLHLPSLNGSIEYLKTDALFEGSFPLKLIGTSSFSLRAGKVWDPAPLYLLFNGHAANSKSHAFAQYAFQTMGMIEFMSSEYASLFYSHSFENLLFKNLILRLHHGMAIGRMANPEEHLGMTYKVYNKGYYESGLSVDKIISSGFIDIGIGGFYRYGPYAFADPLDNFAWRITLQSSLL